VNSPPEAASLSELQGRFAAALREAGPQSEAAIREQLAALAAAVDLREPFERIRAAIDEAQRHSTPPP
jgi:hypothetical protein